MTAEAAVGPPLRVLVVDDDRVDRMAVERHLAALTGPAPHWPEGTRHVSQLRLSLRLDARGLLGALTGPRTLHLDIVDYPGEWLLDLGLLEKSFSDWSVTALAKARTRPGSGSAECRTWCSRSATTVVASPASRKVLG